MQAPTTLYQNPCLGSRISSLLPSVPPALYHSSSLLQRNVPQIYLNSPQQPQAALQQHPLPEARNLMHASSQVQNTPLHSTAHGICSANASIDPRRPTLEPDNNYYNSASIYPGLADKALQGSAGWTSHQNIRTIHQGDLVRNDGWPETLETNGYLPWPGMSISPTATPVLTSTCPKLPDMIERTLANWIKKSKPLPSNSSIQAKARYFAEMSGDDEDHFAINSPGWLERFKQRYTIENHSVDMGRQ